MLLFSDLTTRRPLCMRLWWLYLSFSYTASNVLT
jgi:hypothetical protein